MLATYQFSSHHQLNHYNKYINYIYIIMSCPESMCRAKASGKYDKLYDEIDGVYEYSEGL